MKTISQTAAAIKYFEMAIEEMRESLSREIEQDENIKKFNEKVKEIKDNFRFVFYPHTLSFALNRSKFSENGEFEFLSYFEIIGGIVVFSENTFEGVEDIAVEAQRITQKYFKEEN
ncbi:MAG: hypothetical protein WC272_01690 [Sulfurimonas sp.]